MSAIASPNNLTEVDLVMLKGLDSLETASDLLFYKNEAQEGLIKKARDLLRDQMVFRSTKKKHSNADKKHHGLDNKPVIGTLINEFINEHGPHNRYGCSVASIQHERITGHWPIRVNIVVSDDALLHGSYAAFIDFRDITDAYRNKLELAKACIHQTNAFSVFAADTQHVWNSYRNPREPHTFWGVYLMPGEATIDLNKLAEGDIDGAVESIDQVLAPVKKLTSKRFPPAKNLVVEC